MRTLEEKTYYKIKKENCYKSYSKGPCDADMPRAYYDSGQKACKQFDYGGCEGYVPFDSVEECRLYCE